MKSQYVVFMTQKIQTLWTSLKVFILSNTNTAEDILITGFTLILFSSVLFIFQLQLGSTFLNTISGLAPNSKVTRRILAKTGNAEWVGGMFATPLRASSMVFFYYLFNHGGSGYSLMIHTDLSFVPINSVDVCLSFRLDDISVGFLATTTLIGSTVSWFAPYYMHNERECKRFINLLNSFLFSMIFLIMSSNFLSFLLFWELIGVFSYFLINFWALKGSTFKSATKALLFNLFSDAMLILGMVQYYWWFGTFQFPATNTATALDMEGGGSLIALLSPLFLAASCKSVQFLYHFWLPDSMDAPVPASALIHSATLVAAGILLVLRIKPLLVLDLHIPSIHSYMALLTIVVGGLSATNQTDLKKILAYSTISNCGYMMFLAINSTELATLVLFISHGLLKAISFMFIGLLILLLDHKQSYKYAGNLAAVHKLLFFGTAISVATLGAAPTTVMGFVKHKLFYTGAPTLTDPFITQLALSIGGLTSILYSTKLIYYVFLGTRNRISLGRSDVVGALSHPITDVAVGRSGKQHDRVLRKLLLVLLQSLIIVLYLYIVYLGNFKVDTAFSHSTRAAGDVEQFGSFYVEYANRWAAGGPYQNPHQLGLGTVRFIGFAQIAATLGVAIPLWSGQKRPTVFFVVVQIWAVLSYVTLV